MSKIWTKWYWFVGSMIGVMCCALGCVSITNIFSTQNPTETFPIRTLSIRIEAEQREKLFSQLRKFSDENDLKFNLSFYENKKEFFAVMDGKGFEITASPRPITTTEIRMNFYEKDPANSPSQETIDELFNDLKKFISEIPNVTILEEK